MASSNFVMVGEVNTAPKFIKLADGGTVEVGTFEAEIKGFKAGTPMQSGHSAAALWEAAEQKRLTTARR